MLRLAVFGGCLLATCCGAGGGGGPSPGSVQRYALELQLCVDVTNQYRASVGRAALTRSPELDTYAAAAARNDGTEHSAHQYFERTSGGGVARAENEIPWWPLSTIGSVRNVVQQGLARMWAEGSAGGHYRNITGPYTQIGCGIFASADKVTVVEAFR
jgi:uncharacterized protein YkwD